MEQSAGTDVTLSLFGGLCSQTASPLLLCIWLARMAKGKGYKCRVGASQEMESTLLLCMYGAERRDRRLSLFGGLCSQTVPPSNYVYIELSARIDASPALGCLHGLSSTPLHLVSSYGKGQRVQMSRRAFHVNSAHAHMENVHPSNGQRASRTTYVRLGWLAPARQ